MFVLQLQLLYDVALFAYSQAVQEFVVKLKAEGYFAKEVASNGVAFHSYYMSAIAPKLKEALDKVPHLN